jgi:hypothetical protein
MADVGPVLAPWSGFYVLTGSAAASLTGLMFVVITIVTGRETARSSDGIAAFSTPTVAHFASVLVVSATAAAPFHATLPLAILFGAYGCAGALYVVRVATLAARLATYQPDAEDWIFHTLLPAAAYVAIALGGALLALHPERALVAPAVGVGMLLAVGIHNAWDVVTYLATGQAGEDAGATATATVARDAAREGDTPQTVPAADRAH